MLKTTAKHLDMAFCKNKFRLAFTALHCIDNVLTNCSCFGAPFPIVLIAKATFMGGTTESFDAQRVTSPVDNVAAQRRIEMWLFLTSKSWTLRASGLGRINQKSHAILIGMSDDFEVQSLAIHSLTRPPEG